MRFIFALSLSLCLLFVHAPTLAQAPIDPCLKAESTADNMACAKTRFDAAQKDLNDSFERVLILHETAGAQSPEARQPILNLKQSQNEWLAYRDKECARQVAEEETESLKRLVSLECGAALSEQRTKTLLAQIENAEQTARPEQFNALPKWMNALAKDHPGIFWRYGQRLSADLNCDKENEEILTGLQRAKDPDGGPNSILFAVLAISDNPEAGRPSAQIFTFPLNQTGQEGTFCSEDINLSIVPLPVRKDQEACPVILRLEAPECSMAYHLQAPEKGAAQFIRTLQDSAQTRTQ